MAFINIEIKNRLGIIELNRPNALNALSQDMILALDEAFLNFAQLAEVKIVAITGVKGRAFCAGGDVVEARNTGLNDRDAVRQYFFNEYRLNHLIANFEKPVVSIMDGLTFGGGVGLGCHAKYRCVTPNAQLAMPETAIGFLPDVGGTYLLSRAPGALGIYLGLTGARMKAEDALYCGFADHLIDADNVNELLNQLAENKNISGVLKPFSQPQNVWENQSELKRLQPEIDALFSTKTALECYEQLKASGQPEQWQQHALEALDYASPTSLTLSFEAIKQAKQQDLAQCLINEYRAAARLMDESDFYEGVRAALVDKDRKPDWSPTSLAQVDITAVRNMLEPLSSDLHFKR